MGLAKDVWKKMHEVCSEEELNGILTSGDFLLKMANKRVVNYMNGRFEDGKERSTASAGEVIGLAVPDPDVKTKTETPVVDKPEAGNKNFSKW